MIRGLPVNVECKTRTDDFPFGGQPNDEGIYAGTRATIDPNVAEDAGLRFNSQGVEPPHTDMPESTVIQERLLKGLAQLPDAGCNLIVWGEIEGRRENMEGALYGTEMIRSSPNQADPTVPFVPYRLPTGAFSPGDAGVHFRTLSGVLWVQLRRNGDFIQKNYRLYRNPNTIVQLPENLIQYPAQLLQDREPPQDRSRSESDILPAPNQAASISGLRKIASIFLGFFYGGSLLNGVENGLEFVTQANDEYVLGQWPIAEAVVRVAAGGLGAFLTAYSAQSASFGVWAGGIFALAIILLSFFVLDELPSTLSWITVLSVVSVSFPAASYGQKFPLPAEDARSGRLFGVSWKHWLWLWFPWQLMIANAVWVAYPASLQLGKPSVLVIAWELLKAPISIVLVGYGVVKALESIREDAPYTRAQALGWFLFWLLIFPILVNLLRLI